MAQRGRPLDVPTLFRLFRLRAAGCSIRGLARTLHLSRNTVRAYLRRGIPYPARRAA